MLLTVAAVTLLGIGTVLANTVTVEGNPDIWVDIKCGGVLVGVGGFSEATTLDSDEYCPGGGELTVVRTGGSGIIIHH